MFERSSASVVLLHPALTNTQVAARLVVVAAAAAVATAAPPSLVLMLLLDAVVSACRALLSCPTTQRHRATHTLSHSPHLGTHTHAHLASGMAADQAKKMAEMQRRIQLQNTITAEALKDLASWEDEIEKKDIQLKKTSAVLRKLPPVRSHAASAQPTQPTQPTQAEEGRRPTQQATRKGDAEETKAEAKDDASTSPDNVDPKKRIKGSDFRAWDKFDAVC